jgi:DNA-binding MarR family transcriptional regulator
MDRAGAGPVTPADASDRIRILFREIFFKSRGIARRRLGHFGLTPVQFMMLGAAMRMEEASVGQLAEEVGIQASTASRILDRLERLGYVRRSVSRGDRRRIRVHLRPKGTALRKRVGAFWGDMGKVMLRDFSDGERRRLERALARVHSNLMGEEKQRT